MTSLSSSRKRWPKPIATLVFALVSFPMRVMISVALIVLVSVGIATAGFWIGIGVLAITARMLPYLADLERFWIWNTLGIKIAKPLHKPCTGNFGQRLLTPLTDPVNWRALLYHLLALPIGYAEFGVGIASLVLHPLAVWVLPPLGLLHAKLAVLLLGPNSLNQRRVQTTQSDSNRTLCVGAAQAERKRIEQDLHDGAQQRLVSVAMGIGRSKSKLDTEPSTARVLMDEAHSDAKEAITEIRNLTRGLYPVASGEHGLDAALSALVAKSRIPVTVEVDVSPRPSIVVENTAYFIVSEAVTNVTKHVPPNGAQVRVEVHRKRDRVFAEIMDNGSGGAHIAPGGGLAGLVDRAATIGGKVKVLSPIGGPTVIKADLPCV